MRFETAKDALDEAGTRLESSKGSEPALGISIKAPEERGIPFDTRMRIAELGFPLHAEEHGLFGPAPQITVFVNQKRLATSRETLEDLLERLRNEGCMLEIPATETENPV